MIPAPEDGRPDDTRPIKALTPGTEVSHYRIIEKLGEGGMGVVYKAEDIRLNRTVALKFLPPHLVFDSDAKARFEHEARAASGLNHPNIATIYEIDEADGRSFIAMELVDGVTLKDRLKARDLSPVEILDLAVQIGEGLSAAHENGVTHRDVKPENIMLTKRGAVKIMDFGLAKLRGVTRLTKTGTTLGTLRYMSPEQVRGGEVDHRSDLFALGAIIYEMVTGNPPFKGEYEEAVLYSILNEVPDPLARYSADVSDGMQRIVDKALSKDASERYQHADEMVADLKHEKRLLEADAGVTSGVRMASRGGRRMMRILVPVAIAVLLLLLVLVFQPFRLNVGQDSQAIAMNNSLAIMYFENMADPADTAKVAQMATALLITGLSESEYMYVISRQRLYDILRQMGKENETTIDRSTATEIAERAGARWILTGTVLESEPNIVLTSDISEASSGRIIGTQRAAGDPGDDIFSVVDKLSAEVKADLELSGQARHESSQSVADVTTHSEEAYRYYLEGMDYDLKFYDHDAVASFQKAIRLDSTFAMAYYRMAMLEAGAERRKLTAKATRYIDKVSRRERYLLRAWDAFAAFRYEESAQILEEAIRKYPDDKEAFYMAAIVYAQRLNEYDKAIAHLTRAIEIDPLYKVAYNLLAYAYDYAGDFDRSIWAINRYIELAPDEANPYDTKGEIYARNGRLDAAIESFERALAIKPDNLGTLADIGDMYLFKGDYARAEEYYRMLASSPVKFLRSQGRLCLANIPTRRGRFGEALEVLDEGLAGDALEDYKEEYNSAKHLRKSLIYWARGEPELAVTEVNLASEIYHQAYPAAPNNHRDAVTAMLAMTGNVEAAEKVARSLYESLEANPGADESGYYWAVGCIEAARGDLDRAISYVRRALELSPRVSFLYQYTLGGLFLEAGRLDEAVKALETALSRYEGIRSNLSIMSVRAHYLLGQAYERSGWDRSAIEEYQQFLDIWKDADQGIPEIEDARLRLSRLKGAGHQVNP